MQCFTYENKYPRTVLWKTYQPPDLQIYKRPKPASIDPTKNGRPFCPDLRRYPKNILDVTYLQYNPPLDAPHRERKMPEMLAHINRVNFTTGRDAQVLGRRKSRLSDSLHHSLQSTTRAHYRDPKLAGPPKIFPDREYVVGISPCVYPPPYVPFHQHPYTMRTYVQELPREEDHHTRCGKHTVPREIPAPFPGPKLPVKYVSNTGDDTRKTAKVMGLVP